MSYILEALKKAERERSLGEVPKLETMHFQPALRRSRSWLWLGLALLANAALVASLTLSLRNGISSNKQEPLATVPQEPAKPPSIEATPAPESLPTASMKLASSTPSAPPPPKPEPEPIPETPRPRVVFMPHAITTAEAPPLQSLSSEFRRSLRTLNLDVHVYGQTPQERFVLINSRRYKEGEQLNEGPLVQAITPQGVILLYHGQRFLLSLKR